MSDPRSIIEEIGRELSEYRISVDLVDTLGGPIPAAALTNLTLTLYAESGTTLINNVQRQNILNSGRGTIDGTGHLVITLGTNDMPILDTGAFEEWHIALIEWNYNGGISQGRHELAFRVRNMALVP